MKRQPLHRIAVPAQQKWRRAAAQRPEPRLPVEGAAGKYLAVWTKGQGQDGKMMADTLGQKRAADGVPYPEASFLAASRQHSPIRVIGKGGEPGISIPGKHLYIPRWQVPEPERAVGSSA